MRSMRRLTLTLLMLAGAGCASDSRQDLAEEASRLVPLGVTAAEARTALVRAGFTCQDGGDSAAVTADILCSRERSHRVPATRIHRVMLSLAPGRERITEMRVADPACAGL